MIKLPYYLSYCALSMNISFFNKMSTNGLILSQRFRRVEELLIYFFHFVSLNYSVLDVESFQKSDEGFDETVDEQNTVHQFFHGSQISFVIAYVIENQIRELFELIDYFGSYEPKFETFFVRLLNIGQLEISDEIFGLYCFEVN